MLSAMPQKKKGTLMAKYSSPWNIQDAFIREFSVESDHEEAALYIDKLLKRINAEPNAKHIAPLVKQLSIIYATYTRAFYESMRIGDQFYQKYREYEVRLVSVTKMIIRKDIAQESGDYKKSVKGFEKLLEESNDTAKGCNGPQGAG